jgi:tRNA(fMet)-specific endonuclease VapC
MPRFLLDTDHLTLYQHDHPLLVQRFAAQPHGAIVVCPVNVEEALRGRLAKLARQLTGPARIKGYEDLVATMEMFLEFEILPFDDLVEDRFQRLCALRLRVGTADLKIAAVALTYRLTLLTRNRRDFARIPGLVLDDWSI